MAEAATTVINYPEWTEYRKKNGLDPLGMQNSSVSLYQTFLPGISNVTLRMRYYGLYAWLCRTYAQKDGDTNPESWKRFIRRAEAHYALIAYRQSTESGIAAAGVAGIEWAQKTLDNTSGEIVEFASAAEPGSETHYLKQAWGAYGAAYRSQLFEIGVFDQSKDHELPIPSPEIGDRLATAFADSIGKGGELFYEIVQRGNVTKAALDQLAPLGASEISLQSAERALYQDLLLAPVDPDDVGARSRRLSVLLILKITALLGRDPKPEEVRWILFAGTDQKGQTLTLGSSELQAQRQLWRVYHANDLCHIAIETLLKFTLDTLAEYPAGITLARLIPLSVAHPLEAGQQAPANWGDYALLDRFPKVVHIEGVHRETPNGPLQTRQAPEANDHFGA